MLNEAKHTFAIYTPQRTQQRWPIRLAAATELEMHDWVRRTATLHKMRNKVDFQQERKF